MGKLNLKKVLEDLVEVKWLEDPEEKEKAFDLLKAISQDESEEAVQFITKLYDSITEIVKGEDEVEEKEPEKEPEEKEVPKEESKEEDEKEELEEAKQTEIEIPKTNLYITGKGMDANGNGVVYVKTPNQKATAIQTNGNLPSVHGKAVEDIDEKGMKEIVDYVKKNATGKLKENFKEFIKEETDLEVAKKYISLDEKKDVKKKNWRVIKEGVVVDVVPYEESIDKDGVKGSLTSENYEFDDVEEEEMDEPQEDDYILAPSGSLGAKTSISQSGKNLGTFDDEDEAEKFIINHMKKNNYYPSVWYNDDHGGYTIRTLKTESSFADLDKERFKKRITGEVNLTEASNPEVIGMFISDSFPKDKKPTWGTDNLKITKMDNGWALVNYSTPILFRNSDGDMFFNSQKYSVTTSKIQSAIKSKLEGDFKEVDEKGIKEAIDKKVVKEELTESDYDDRGIVSIITVDNHKFPTTMGVKSPMGVSAIIHDEDLSLEERAEILLNGKNKIDTYFGTKTKEGIIDMIKKDKQKNPNSYKAIVGEELTESVAMKASRLLDENYVSKMGKGSAIASHASVLL